MMSPAVFGLATLRMGEEPATSGTSLAHLSCLRKFSKTNIRSCLVIWIQIHHDPEFIVSDVEAIWLLVELDAASHISAATSTIPMTVCDISGPHFFLHNMGY